MNNITMPANGGLVAHAALQHQQIPSFHNAPSVQDEEMQRRQNNGINKYRQRHEEALARHDRTQDATSEAQHRQTRELLLRVQENTARKNSKSYGKKRRKVEDNYTSTTSSTTNIQHSIKQQKQQQHQVFTSNNQQINNQQNINSFTENYKNHKLIQPGIIVRTGDQNYLQNSLLQQNQMPQQQQLTKAMNGNTRPLNQVSQPSLTSNVVNNNTNTPKSNLNEDLNNLVSIDQSSRKHSKSSSVETATLSIQNDEKKQFMMDLLVDDKPFSSSPLRDDKASSDYSETFLDEIYEKVMETNDIDTSRNEWPDATEKSKLLFDAFFPEDTIDTSNSVNLDFSDNKDRVKSDTSNKLEDFSFLNTTPPVNQPILDWLSSDQQKVATNICGINDNQPTAYQQVTSPMQQKSLTSPHIQNLSKSIDSSITVANLQQNHQIQFPGQPTRTQKTAIRATYPVQRPKMPQNLKIPIQQQLNHSPQHISQQLQVSRHQRMPHQIHQDSYRLPNHQMSRQQPKHMMLHPSRQQNPQTPNMTHQQHYIIQQQLTENINNNNQMNKQLQLSMPKNNQTCINRNMSNRINSSSVHVDSLQRNKQQYHTGLVDNHHGHIRNNMIQNNQLSYLPTTSNDNAKTATSRTIQIYNPRVGLTSSRKQTNGNVPTNNIKLNTSSSQFTNSYPNDGYKQTNSFVQRTVPNIVANNTYSQSRVFPPRHDTRVDVRYTQMPLNNNNVQNSNWINNQRPLVNIPGILPNNNSGSMRFQHDQTRPLDGPSNLSLDQSNSSLQTGYAHFDQVGMVTGHTGTSIRNFTNNSGQSTNFQYHNYQQRPVTSQNGISSTLEQHNNQARVLQSNLTDSGWQSRQYNPQVHQQHSIITLAHPNDQPVHGRFGKTVQSQFTNFNNEANNVAMIDQDIINNGIQQSQPNSFMHDRRYALTSSIIPKQEFLRNETSLTNQISLTSPSTQRSSSANLLMNTGNVPQTSTVKYMQQQQPIHNHQLQQPQHMVPTQLGQFNQNVMPSPLNGGNNMNVPSHNYNQQALSRELGMIEYIDNK